MIVLTTAPVTSGGHRTERHGLTNRQVRELLDYEDVGTHQMATGLCRAGLAERDESARPMIYRLGSKLREG
jgi:DNA-binding IclR family transcriptional regulator